MTFHQKLPDDFSGGLVNWRLRVLHWTAKALGLLVHVEGFPYGTRRNMPASPGRQEPSLMTRQWRDLNDPAALR